MRAGGIRPHHGGGGGGGGGGGEAVIPSSASSLPTATSHDERSAVAAHQRHSSGSGIANGNSRYPAGSAAGGGGGQLPSSYVDNDLADYPPMPIVDPNAGNGVGRRRTGARNDGKDAMAVIGGPATAPVAPVELMGDDRPIRGKASAQQAPVPSLDDGHDEQAPVAAAAAARYIPTRLYCSII
jgi:hypothetical protein